MIEKNGEKALREWRGLVMSDWVVKGLAVKGSKYRTARAAESIKAGNDLFMPGNSEDYKAVLAALKKENPDVELSREEVEYCAAHIVETAWKVKSQAPQSVFDRFEL